MMPGRLCSIILIIILLCFSLGTLWLVFEVHREKLFMRLDPQQTYFYSRKNRELSLINKMIPRIVLFGDSRIQMWKNQLKIDGYQIINRGIAGETTAQSLLRVENDILAINADVVVIQIGINDLKTIVFFESREGQIIDATKHNILVLVNKLKSRGIKVYLMTIIPASEPVGVWRLFWSERIDREVVAINQFIRKQQEENVSIIDSTSILNDGEKLKPDYTLDTLHLNDAGYSVLSSLLKKTFQKQ